MRKLVFTALAALAATVGCRQCASPYDYCSPVVENGPQCGSGAMEGETYGPDYAANRGRPAPQNSAPQYSESQNPAGYDGPRTASAQQDDGSQESQQYTR